MNTPVVITVYLLGQLSGFCAHTHKQSHTALIAGGKRITKTITHSDRTPLPCIKNTKISEEVVNSWLKGDCPNWIKPSIWKRSSEEQKLSLYISGFDEGFGVTYEKL